MSFFFCGSEADSEGSDRTGLKAGHIEDQTGVQGKENQSQQAVQQGGPLPNFGHKSKYLVFNSSNFKARKTSSIAFQV